MSRPIPANIIIHAPVALTTPVERRRKSSIVSRPSPTSTVTAIISIVTDRMSPVMPDTKAPSPTTASHATNGNTAAAVQSTEAAL